MSYEEKKKAKDADRELSSGRPLSKARRRALRLDSTPLKGQEIVYRDLLSAQRGIGHLIERVESKIAGIEGLNEDITKLNRRINEVRIGEPELLAKLKALERIASKLDDRNSVYAVDSYSDLASISILEAHGELESGRWTVACTKLVAARNILERKIKHWEKEVLPKNRERQELLDEIIYLRQKRNERIREALFGISNQLEEQELVSKALGSAIKRLAEDFRFPLFGAITKSEIELFANRLTEILPGDADLERARTHVLNVLEPSGYFESSLEIESAKGILSNKLDAIVREASVKHSKTLAELAGTLKNAKETILIEVWNGLASARTTIVNGKLGQARAEIEDMVGLLNKADELTGKEKK
ncbi:MAG: hypothetical protein V1909_03050 [Candidatus Micrarchaeota archaeon]